MSFAFVCGDQLLNNHFFQPRRVNYLLWTQAGFLLRLSGSVSGVQKWVMRFQAYVPLLQTHWNLLSGPEIPFGRANVYLALLCPALMHLAAVITSPVPGVPTNSRPIRLKSEAYLVTRILGILPADCIGNPWKATSTQTAWVPFP